MKRWDCHETQYLLVAAQDGHTAAAIGKAINRTPKSVARKIGELGIRLRFKRGNLVRFYLTDELMLRLQELGDGLGMNKTRTARMILVATLRDPHFCALVVRP